MARLLLKPPNRRIRAEFIQRICALEEYDLIDIMVALADQRGGTTPLYDAVEAAGEEIDAG
jgi:hypothetical protein